MPEIRTGRFYLYPGNLFFFTGNVKDAPLYLRLGVVKLLDFLFLLAFVLLIFS